MKDNLNLVLEEIFIQGNRGIKRGFRGKKEEYNNNYNQNKKLNDSGIKRFIRGRIRGNNDISMRYNNGRNEDYRELKGSNNTHHRSGILIKRIII